eukprot:CAMPEP_0118863790 /NCGR_PEP_ID=MMETSP1163-20130328/8537_1 /TAXON_ID=124430 /ORGANISM="Phaeomonas parva, Strain CCMP2877" /LENGTH=252 /DNA_ID=CAMNT_0006797825 /DNA_START=206 /DNA_END=964 /DNA_ORIENTATION=-
MRAALLALLLLALQLASALRRPVRMAARPVSVQQVRALDDDITSAFVQGFWGEGLTEGQLKQLNRDVLSDLTNRYVSRDGDDGRSTLLMLRKGGQPVAFAGVEVVPSLRQYLGLSRYEYDEIVGGLLGEAPGTLFTDPPREAAVLSNLVVLPTQRRRGHANHLMRCAEQVVRKWGKEDVYLSVDAANDKALKLYGSRGYKEICGRMGNALKATDTTVITSKVSELCLRKTLSPVAALAEAPPSLLYNLRNLV